MSLYFKLGVKMVANNKADEIGIDKVTPPKSVANYIGHKVVNDLVYISGQLPMLEGKISYTGKLGDSVSLDTGKAAARLCAINVLSQLRSACDGDLTRVAECIRLAAFINCTPDFTDQSKVANGASDLIVEVFGDPGRHVRVSIGVSSLPLGATVEVEATFRINKTKN